MHRPARTSQPGRSREKRLAAIEWLTDFLLAESPQGVLAGQVQTAAHKVGITPRTLRRAADDLEIVRTLGGGPYTRWALSEDHRKLLKGERH